MIAKMQRGGANLSPEDQQRFMASLDENLSKIGEILARDEQDQDDMLKRKLEDRMNRRRKLQDKLKEQEKAVEIKR